MDCADFDAAAAAAALQREFATDRTEAGGGAAIVLDAEQIEVTALCGVPVPDRRRLNDNLEDRWEKFIVRVQTDVVNGDVERLRKRLEWNQQEIAKNQNSEDYDPTYDNWLDQKIAYILAAINELVSVSPSPQYGA